jgi:phosphoribosyl-ATP pyrophosphohydrolase/phosphoribosyl-AMP cyclohydrolase
MVDINAIRWDERGLVPTVIQDVNTQQVLMVAYMNRESLTKTLETGETVFWSRSRAELWHKGDTSGNTQKVREILIDCDEDTLLITVDPTGAACHTGEMSCFYRSLERQI